MVKIKNKQKLKWALKQYEKGAWKQKDLASRLGVTPRRFRQLYSTYRNEERVPLIGKNLGRPKRDIPSEYERIILAKHGQYKLNAVYLERVIYVEDDLRIPHNAIQAVLKSTASL